MGSPTCALRNPERRNAISTSMWQAIAEFAAAAGSRSDVRVVIVRGDGERAFSVRRRDYRRRGPLACECQGL